MEWDLGFKGIALLLAMSLGFGLVAQMIMRRVATHILWLFAAITFFVTGVFTRRPVRLCHRGGASTQYRWALNRRGITVRPHIRLNRHGGGLGGGPTRAK